MAKIEEYCEVRTERGIYRDWTTVAVSYTAEDRNTPRRFKLITAEPSDKTVFRLLPEDRVDIALAGFVVIKGGYITDRQVGYDANRHGVTLDGFSSDGKMAKVSVDVPGGEFRNYGIEAIANRVLQPHGLRFVVRNPPRGALDPFPRVSVRDGETALDFLARLTKVRGLRMVADADGTIKAGPPSAGTGVTLEEGRNILSATCHITSPHAVHLVARSQAAGGDGLFGKAASEIQATSTFAKGTPGLTRKIEAEMPLQAKEMQTRLNMAVADLQASMLRVTVVHQGWLKPGGEGLWELSDAVTVRSPMLFPVEGGQLDLRVWQVTYAQDAQAGTTTSLELVNDAAWQVVFPNANAPSPYFNQPATPAQPDTPT